MNHLNPHGQPVGFPVPNWTQPPWPSTESMTGRTCRVERLDANRYAEQMFAADALDADGIGWTYLPYGAFETLTSYVDSITTVANEDDPLFYAIVDPNTNKPLGVASYLRIAPVVG